MKKITFITAGVLLIFLSCNNQKQLIESSVIKPDSTVSDFYGKEISNIIFSPEKVKVYKIRPKTKADSTIKIIGNFAVDSLLGELDKSYYSILQFMLHDSTNYRFDSLINKCQFSPHIAYEFSKNNKKASILLNLGCKQWGVSYKDTVFYEENNCEYKLLRFTHLINTNDKYINTLINLK